MLDAVRKACLPAIWSQGVKLARENAVARTSESDGEATFRVRAATHPVAPTVTLYFEDEEWSCDCGGKVDPCPHVAAAAIAHESLPKGASAAAESAAATIGYRLAARDGRLTLARVIVRAGKPDEPIRGSVASDPFRIKNRDLAPTHDDVRIDRVVASTSRDQVPLERMSDVLDALSSAADVTLDGAPIRTSSERVKPRATVSDAPNGGFTLKVEKDPRVEAVVALGVAKVSSILRPLGETSTTGERLERLPLVRTFARNEETELVTRVIPELEKSIEVTIATTRLAKKSVHARPRIELDLSHVEGHTLSVLPLLVYGDPPIARVDGDQVVSLKRGGDVPVRKLDQERALVQRLRAELDLVLGRRVHFQGAEATRFAARIRAFQDLVGEHEHAEVFEGAPLHARLVVTDDGAFDVELESEVVDDKTGQRKKADLALVLRAYKDGLDVVPLDGGGWAPLPAGWLAQHGARVADLLAARDPETKKLPRAAFVDLAALADALGEPRPAVTSKLAPVLDGFEGIPKAALPADLHATLRDYQARGVDWLAFLRGAGLGGVLADDMGLGKTLQAICALPAGRRALVVCPKSVVYNWQAELARFRPGLSVHVFHGPTRALDPKADVTLTTYAVLRIDAELLAKESWDTVVLDEAQAIKNEASQTARAAFALSADFKLALSGTPVENRLEELWSVMTFANPGLLGGRASFQDRYVSPIASHDEDAAARLRAKIRPVVLRRMKRDVLPELPPRTDVVLHVELDEEERIVYDAVRAATKKELAAKLAEGAGVLAALEALLRLRQASCHSALVPGQKAEGSSKVEALLGALEDAAAGGHKALVFSQWTSLLDLVEPHLRAAGIRFTRLDGSTKDRGAVVDAFQDPSGPPVLIASLKAGGTGLNLTAADHVFLLDPWWNPAAEDQAADRAHRIGQDRPVMVYRLVAKDTVEERILALQEKKRALADVALGEAGAAAGVTREDLLALLE
ncbi:MAG: DEAD/DEAH box helicase [Labilithrix sp.]|nr:DEAD/DEAH box helicase [Labilithrix sp.]MCW5817801.1 DEAD/DEAH box helicase [Labilithrix sp.]